MNLEDKVAVVTGASSGIGLAFSKALIERGAHVFGLARREARLQEIRGEFGERFHPVRCDVSAEDQVQQAFETVLTDAGRIDLLINNAGLGRFGKIEELPVDVWDEQIATNLRGVFLCTRAAVPAMKRQNAESGFGGHIINIASIAGLLGNPTLGAYNASKFGVRGLSEALMKELREDGIKVSCVYPGSIETEFASSGGRFLSKNAMQAVDVAATVMHLIETPDNYLISEIVLRPLRPKG